MTVPKAAVDKDCDAESGQHDIGCTWQSLCMKAITIAKAEQLFSESNFRL